MSNKELEGQVALVTGASYGLGRAITESLLARGAAVMLTDIDGRLESTTTELRALGSRVGMAPLNVLDRDSVFAAVSATMKEFGRLDIFVNNAGWSKSMNLIQDISADEWDLYMNINVRGNLFCIQAAAEAMAAGGNGGRFVSIVSTAALKPYKRAAAYCTSKSAIPMLLKAAALELAEHRITVNGVAPGPTTTETNLMHSSGALDPAMGEAKRRRQALIPLGINAPEDIANAVAYFASPGASHVTGQMLTVEGGGQLI